MGTEKIGGSQVLNLAIGIIGEHLVIQVFVILKHHFNEDSNKLKILLLGFLRANMTMIVGTVSRDGFLVFISASLLFYFIVRRDFGAMMLIKLGSLGVPLFALAGKRW